MLECVRDCKHVESLEMFNGARICLNLSTQVLPAKRITSFTPFLVSTVPTHELLQEAAMPCFFFKLSVPVVICFK